MYGYLASTGKFYVFQLFPQMQAVVTFVLTSFYTHNASEHAQNDIWQWKSTVYFNPELWRKFCWLLYLKEE